MDLTIKQHKSLPLYNENKLCPACLGTQALVRHVACAIKDSYDKSHMVKTCRVCGHKWAEMPIYLLHVVDREIANLRRLIGSGLWLDTLDDDQWRILWSEIVPSLLSHAKLRGEQINLRD